jgi:hypothetical protein
VASTTGDRSLGHEEAQQIGMPGSSTPRRRIAALSSSCRRSSLHFLLRLALLAWMPDSLIRPAYPLDL